MGPMPGMAGAGAAKKAKKAPAKGRRVSGNPAKAAAEAKARQQSMQEKLAGSLGAPAEIDYEKAAANLELPQDFSKFLK
jgi:signal recognition particle subunit SRP54